MWLWLSGRVSIYSFVHHIYLPCVGWKVLHSLTIYIMTSLWWYVLFRVLYFVQATNTPYSMKCSLNTVQLCCAKASMARSLLHHSEPPLLCQDFTRSTINNQNIVCLKLFTKILYRLYSYDNSWTALSAFHGSRLNEQNSVQNKDWKFSSARANLENGYGVFLFVWVFVCSRS